MKNILLALCLVISANIFAQNSTQNQFSLNLITPSAEYELSIGDRSSLDFVVGIGFAYRRIFDESGYAIFPSFMAQYRYYYNFAKRLEKGKNVANNSGNYLTAVAIVSGGDALIGDLYSENGTSGVVGPAWGLQRVYGKHFKLNLDLGLGYGFNNADSYLAPIIVFQLGWKLGK